MDNVLITYGCSIPKYIKCTNHISNKWIISFDIVKYDEETYTYKQFKFSHKPTIEEVKEVITQYYNEKANNEIINGFKWNDMNIWLSLENQINYKAIYDLININENLVFPLHLKFHKNGEDIIYTFETKDEYLDFYSNQIIYVKDILQTYWDVKSNIDYNNYI